MLENWIYRKHEVAWRSALLLCSSSFGFWLSLVWIIFLSTLIVTDFISIPEIEWWWQISRMSKKKKIHTHVPFQNQLNYYEVSLVLSKVCVLGSDVDDAIVLPRNNVDVASTLYSCLLQLFFFTCWEFHFMAALKGQFQLEKFIYICGKFYFDEKLH